LSLGKGEHDRIRVNPDEPHHLGRIVARQVEARAKTNLDDGAMGDMRRRMRVNASAEQPAWTT